MPPDMPVEPKPTGVWAAAGFFAGAGALEIVLGLALPARPLTFWMGWEAVGRGLLHFVVAAGLWRQKSFCRSVALVYCVAVLGTYAVVLLAAVSHAAAEFPRALILDSLYQVPSCSLLLPYLRSPQAALVFTRPLFGR